MVHGPHVVQPFEMVGGTAVWWSAGNFVSEMGPPSVGRYESPRTADGVLAHIEFVERDDGSWSMNPRRWRSATTSPIGELQDLHSMIARDVPAGVGRARTVQAAG